MDSYPADYRELSDEKCAVNQALGSLAKEHWAERAATRASPTAFEAVEEGESGGGRVMRCLVLDGAGVCTTRALKPALAGTTSPEHRPAAPRVVVHVPNIATGTYARLLLRGPHGHWAARCASGKPPSP